jgi:large-conductance mechanosensitive channel
MKVLGICLIVIGAIIFAEITIVDILIMARGSQLWSGTLISTVIRFVMSFLFIFFGVKLVNRKRKTE